MRGERGGRQKKTAGLPSAQRRDERAARLVEKATRRRRLSRRRLSRRRRPAWWVHLPSVSVVENTTTIPQFCLCQMHCVIC